MDALDGSSAGAAAGIDWVPLEGAEPARRCARFDAKSRIEYAEDVPAEGTLAMWINVTGAKSEPGRDRASVFSAGTVRLLVAADGGIALSDAASTLVEARETPFRFDSWHAVGVSYGSMGAALMVDGVLVARTPTETRLSEPIVVGGFSGAVAHFRVSATEGDWRAARGVPLDFRRPVDALSSKSVTTPPRAIHTVEPAYSEEARHARFQGTVILQIIVDESGRATHISVLRSLGLGLDEKAVEAVARWRFSPAMKKGRPVAMWATVEVNFRLYQR